MEQADLPTKTKIAAWIMIASGILRGLFAFFYGISGGVTTWFIFTLFIALVYGVFTGFVFTFPPILIIKRKKRGWWLAIFILFPVSLPIFQISPLPSGFMIGPIGSLLYATFYRQQGIPLFIILLAPLCFFLLLLDRKNFFKIAT